MSILLALMGAYWGRWECLSRHDFQNSNDIIFALCGLCGLCGAEDSCCAAAGGCPTALGLTADFFAVSTSEKRVSHVAGYHCS